MQDKLKAHTNKCRTMFDPVMTYKQPLQLNTITTVRKTLEEYLMDPKRAERLVCMCKHTQLCAHAHMPHDLCGHSCGSD